MTKRLYLIITLFIFCSSGSFAQQNWGGGVDDEVIHFGFKFQYIGSEYKILKIEDWRGPFPDPEAPPPGSDLIPNKLKSISSPVTHGFGLGFVSDYKLGDNVNIRFTPGLVFSTIRANYEFDNDPPAIPMDDQLKEVRSTFVDLPLGLKLKSERIRNYRAYILGGIRYSMDIVSKKRKDDSGVAEIKERFLKNVPNALWYEAGVGLDIYFEWFKLSPEIKFAQTTKSVLAGKDRPINPYIAPIDKLFLRNFQFSLYFE